MERKDERELRVIHRVSRFVLNRQTDDIRKELHEYIVSMSLLSSEEFNSFTSGEVISRIEELFGLKDFPSHLVEIMLKSLAERGDISTHQIGPEIKYSLTSNKRNLLGIADKNYSELRAKVENELKELARKRMKGISKSKQSMLMKCLDLTLGHVCGIFSRSSAAAHLGIQTNILTDIAEEGISQAIHSSVCTYYRGSAQEKVMGLLSKYIESPTDALAAYLHSTALSYYMIQILHLDPECQHLTRNEFEERRFYLDTNAIIILLAGSKERKKSMRKLLELSISVGMKPLVTSRTEWEFMKVINRYRSILQKSSPTVERYEKAKDIVSRHGFLDDYMTKKKENPSLTVEGYFARLELFEQILSKWNIELEKVNLEEMMDHPSYEVLKGKILDLRPFKSDLVAEHDAVHILYVDELRQQESGGVLGPKEWFLTFDLSLPFAETVLGRRSRIQASINPDQWLQMLSPILAPDTRNIEVARVYSNLFATRLSATGSLMRSEDFLKIQGKWMDDEDLGASEIKNLIGSQYVKSYLRNTRYEDRSVEGLEKAIEPLLEEIRELKQIERERLAGTRRVKQFILSLFFVIALIVNLVTYFFAPIQLLAIFVAIEIAAVMFAREEVRDIIGLTRSSEENIE